MNIEEYKKKAKINRISLWVFGGTFTATFTILWGFIEPFGGLCKFPYLKELNKCEDNIHIAYSILLVISFIIALITESLRSAIAYRSSLKKIINEIELNNAIVNPHSFSSLIEKEKIIAFLTSETIESDFKIPLNELNIYSIIFLRNLFDLCTWLGLYRCDGETLIPSGEISPFIIKSTFSNLKQSTKLFEAVTCHQGDKDYEKLRDLLLDMEYTRMSHNSSALPIRKINSSIVLIIAFDKNSNPRFLLQHNKAWGDYYWWIGGIEEISDFDHLSCAKRELNEELGIKEKHISKLEFMGKAEETTHSKRLGVLTSYTYNVYTLSLKFNGDDINELFKIENTINLPFQGHNVERKIKWFTWDEIEKNKDLNQDAASILTFIKSKNIHAEFISCQKQVE